jgi:glycosyltransferase involved in cell wall biosynthesis
MKIVYVNPFFTDGMGYIENCLPRAMAKRGHEVHIITSTGKVYFNDPMYKRTYEKFFGPPIEEPGVYPLSGNVKLHRLEFVSILNTLYFKNLKSTLSQIRPDVVHMWDVVTPFSLQFFFLKNRFNYSLYTGNHYVLSVLDVHRQWNNWFSLLKYKWIFLKILPGKILQKFYLRCYAATTDAKFVAEKYMGVPPAKCVVTPLGVDTDMFRPAENPQVVKDISKSLQFSNDDFIILYTGRFTAGKNPLLIAKALDILHSKGHKNIKGLFVGSGDQRNEIEKNPSCRVVDFVPYYELYKYYQIAHVGVWPAQESTSMLDAAATGIPIVVNNTIHAVERYEGNGLTYELGNAEDLASKILRLYQDRELCSSLGRNGFQKMNNLFSWDRIAKEREEDYIKDNPQLK